MGMEALRPGDAMFGPIGGIVPGGFPVGAGQLLLADRKARLSWRTWRKIRHAGMVTEASSFDRSTGIGPKMVQAMPRGAEEIELSAKHWTDEYVYVRPAYERPEIGNHPDFGYAVAHAARKYIGTPYNFLTYGKLAAGRAGLHLSEALLRRWISSRADMMCSQLVDQALTDAGFQVFDDGRLPGDVVPAELFRRLMTMPGALHLHPGRSEFWMPIGNCTHLL